MRVEPESVSQFLSVADMCPRVCLGLHHVYRPGSVPAHEILSDLPGSPVTLAKLLFVWIFTAYPTENLPAPPSGSNEGQALHGTFATPRAQATYPPSHHTGYRIWSGLQRQGVLHAVECARTLSAQPTVRAHILEVIGADVLCHRLVTVCARALDVSALHVTGDREDGTVGPAEGEEAGVYGGNIGALEEGAPQRVGVAPSLLVLLLRSIFALMATYSSTDSEIARRVASQVDTDIFQDRARVKAFQEGIKADPAIEFFLNLATGGRGSTSTDRGGARQSLLPYTLT